MLTAFSRSALMVNELIQTSYLLPSPVMIASNGAVVNSKGTPRTSPTASPRSTSNPMIVVPSVSRNSLGGYVLSVPTTTLPAVTRAAGTIAASASSFVIAPRRRARVAGCRGRRRGRGAAGGEHEDGRRGHRHEGGPAGKGSSEQDGPPEFVRRRAGCRRRGHECPSSMHHRPRRGIPVNATIVKTVRPGPHLRCDRPGRTRRTHARPDPPRRSGRVVSGCSSEGGLELLAHLVRRPRSARSG